MAQYRVRIRTRLEVDAIITADEESEAAEQLGETLPYLTADVARAIRQLGAVTVDDWKVSRPQLL